MMNAEPVRSANDWRISPHERAQLVAAASRGQAAPIALAVSDRLTAGGHAVDVPALLTNAKECAETSEALADFLAQADAYSDGDVPLDLNELARLQPDPPQFILPDWLPAGEVTLLAGDGGTGKSAIALQLAIAIAAGKPFCGIATTRRRVAFMSLEDSAAVLHWRLQRTCAWLGVDLAELAGWLLIYDLSHADAVLMTETRDGPAITPRFDWLKAEIEQREVQVLILDGASDAYGAKENARAAVRQFVRGLRRITPADGATVLLAHVDKATAKVRETSAGYSGSTAWNNSVRSRLYLRRDGERDDDALLLEVQKSNYSKAGASLRLRWNDAAHVFVGELSMPTSQLDRDLADADEREGILAAMAASGGAPAAMTGPRTAHHVLSAQPGFPESLRSGKPAIRRFWQQIEHLRAMGAISEVSIRRSDRHYVRQIVVAPEGARACGQ